MKIPSLFWSGVPAFLDAGGTEKAKATATPDASGAWRLQLPELTPGPTGSLAVQNAKGDKCEIADVITGEV